jgi:hypothetical protein
MGEHECTQSKNEWVVPVCEIELKLRPASFCLQIGFL